jgi:hypothetical protein
LLLTLTPEQFPIDFGDLFQVILEFVIVLDPTADLLDLLVGNDSARCASAPESDGQIPYRPMPFTFRALAGGVSTGYIALDQRSSEDIGDGRKLMGQTLPALAQGQYG